MPHALLPTAAHSSESPGISGRSGVALAGGERLGSRHPKRTPTLATPGRPPGVAAFAPPPIFDNSITEHESWPVVQRKNPSLRRRRSVVRVHPGQPARVAQWQSIRLISGRPVVRSHPCAPSPASSAAEHPPHRRKARGPIPRPGTMRRGWAPASPRRGRRRAFGCAGPTPALCIITAR